MIGDGDSQVLEGRAEGRQDDGSRVCDCAVQVQQYGRELARWTSSGMEGWPCAQDARFRPKESDNWTAGKIGQDPASLLAWSYECRRHPPSSSACCCPECRPRGTAPAAGGRTRSQRGDLPLRGARDGVDSAERQTGPVHLQAGPFRWRDRYPRRGPPVSALVQRGAAGHLPTQARLGADHELDAPIGRGHL